MYFMYITVNVSRSCVCVSKLTLPEADGACSPTVIQKEIVRNSTPDRQNL